MVQLSLLSKQLDRLFDIYAYGKDSAFSRFIPMVYDPIQFNWKAEFTSTFVNYFNGLMLEGAEEVNRVFLAVFPTDGVLERFISEANVGDMLFMHHPLVMECGDPRGMWGRGLVPIQTEYIQRMKEKQLSVYTCHAPMDYHQQYGTSVAIAKALNLKNHEGFVGDENGTVGSIGEIHECSSDELIKKLNLLFDIPYVDFEGRMLGRIRKVAIVAGCGDKANWMKDAEEQGVQAYITGEVHCHIDNDYGRQKFEQMMNYAGVTTMSLIGVSHSASEYLVKKTLMNDWFKQNFEVETILIPQEKWWF